MDNEVKQNLVDSSNQASGEIEKKEAVSYDSFRKSVEAEKNARKRAQELEAKLAEYEHKELESKGKYDEALQVFKKKYEETEAQLKSERESYLWERINSTVKEEAIKAGCENPDKLIKLLDKNDFTMLQADADGYKLKKESVASLVEKAKKENPFLFRQQSVKIHDGVPSNKKEESKLDLSKMDKKEIEEFLLKKFSK